VSWSLGNISARYPWERLFKPSVRSPKPAMRPEVPDPAPALGQEAWASDWGSDQGASESVLARVAPGLATGVEGSDRIRPDRQMSVETSRGFSELRSCRP
jgi:hypothetical protein